LSLTATSRLSAQTQLKVVVQGDSSRLPDFVEMCRREFADHKLKLEVVRPGEAYDYNIVIAQESTFGSAAAAVIVLDNKGMFVASVVRSGRMSGQGALNASAKELAKKISALRNP
jgi:hypothetical protein